MSASLTPTLINKDFQNWLKGALAVIFAKEGLIGLVGNEIIDFQRRLLQTVYTQKGIRPGTLCSSCTTANVLACPTEGFCSKGRKCKAHDTKVPDKKPNQACPNGLCNAIRDAIKKEHRFKGPSWKNTDARKWCSDAFELCKCFMPPDGYSDKTCLDDTDFNGIIAVVINKNRFQKTMSVNLAFEPNICTEARIISRKIRHSSNHLLSDQDLLKYIDDLIILLSDPAYLVADVKANDAVSKLKQLKTNTVTIHADDITNVLNESIKTTFDDQEKTLLREIHEHFRKHKNDSVEVIDRKIQDSVDKHLTELKAQADREKDELNAEKEKGISELKLQSKTVEDDLQSQLEHGKDVLNTHITKANIALNAQTKTIEHKINESIVLYTRAVDNVKYKGIEELQEVTTTGKQELEDRGKHILDQINRSAEFNNGGNGDKLLKEFKKELVRFYNEEESMIPVSPLVEDHAVPLTELYVQPPMSAFNKPNAFGQGNKHSEKTPVRSYRKLFVNDDNVPYKNIYVEANAGYGKTSFTQKVAMTWCQAHRPNTVTKGKFKKKDVDELKRFDFLFLLHLRDFQDDSCNLDELILNFVSHKLPNKEQYSKQFIANILQTKTCLVILDGLDEWVHPESCTRTPGIPHNNYRGNCTVLTTTRPWKFSKIGLPPNLIDRHLEITELDDEKSEKLKSYAVKLLCENSRTLPPNLTDFDRKVSSVKLGDIRLIPYILLQLICSWFDGLNFGNSKCELYSNTIELTLQRGLNKKHLSTLSTGTAERNVRVPACMRHNTLCKQNMNLLLKLGELAFYALFQNIKEYSLVIESTTVLNFLTEQEIEFCLKIGLLSQSKDRSKVAVKRYKVSFQHKSIQEFMAALYIISKWNNTTIKPTILEVCSSLSSILEMENLFVFVCGMNPLVYECISGELQKIVDLDNVTSRLRTDIDSGLIIRTEERTTMNSYQSMQVQCLQESVRNGNNNCLIYLCDIQIDQNKIRTDVGLCLKTIIHLNKGNVKSLLLSYQNDDEIEAFIQSLDPGVFTALETLRVESCGEKLVWLADILTESARTLKYLTLSGCSFISLSDISIMALTGLTCLQSLYLYGIHMTHSFYANISQTTTLTQLKLAIIECPDHKYQYHRDCDVTLDLHRLVKLKMLHLYKVPCSELHVNPTCLEKLEFQPWKKMTARASATLWQDLRAAPVLSSLTLNNISSCQEMMETIPILTQLQHLKLECIDMVDITPRVSPTMTRLECVVLSGTRNSYAALRTLFLSFGQLPQSIHIKLRDIVMTPDEWRELFLIVSQLPHPVTVELYRCWGLLIKEWEMIVKVIKTTPTLSIIQDLSIDDVCASLTLKNKTV